MAGGAPRHTISMTAGGTMPARSHSALFSSVIDAPASAPMAATATSSANPRADRDAKVG